MTQQDNKSNFNVKCKDVLNRWPNGKCNAEYDTKNLKYCLCTCFLYRPNKKLEGRTLSVSLHRLESCQMELPFATDFPLFLLFLPVVGLLVYLYNTWSFGVWKTVGVDGPKPFPFVGNLQEMNKNGNEASINKWSQIYGRTFGIYAGSRPLLVTTDLDILKEVLVKDFNKFVDRFDSFDVFPEGFRSNLFSSRGAQWHRIRHLMTPTFSSGKLKLMDFHINKCSAQLINNIEKAIDEGERIDAKKVYGAFTMDVIARTAFGVEINSQEDLNHPFVRSAQILVNFAAANAWYRMILFAMPCLMPVIRFLLTYVFTTQGWTPFSETVQGIMQQRKSEGKSAQKHTDFLQMILDYEDNEKQENGRLKSLSEAEVLGQATVILLGGYETTSTTLQFLSYNLALHPEIQEKVVQEIKDHLGDGDVTYEDVAKLKYLESVIHETLRMYPPLNVVNRQASETVTIKGVTIPKGAGVVIPIVNVLNDPEYFYEPEKFIPERFLDENKGNRNPISLLQFGFGPRLCIGMRLALLEMKIAMVYVLRRFKFINTDDLQGKVRILPGTLLSGPERPLMIKAVLRD